ncbi:hypothetical protein ACFO4E_11015 [Nocardiopsis mangrovi]|uniref:Uncharacterized protein n=1 Tax=Nocardiopsis mangrovi TaxID=1179818 RepID=A0ABV9DVJ0_9ACTN
MIVRLLGHPLSSGFAGRGHLSPVLSRPGTGIASPTARPAGAEQSLRRGPSGTALSPGPPDGWYNGGRPMGLDG